MRASPHKPMCLGGGGGQGSAPNIHATPHTIPWQWAGMGWWGRKLHDFNLKEVVPKAQVRGPGFAVGGFPMAPSPGPAPCTQRTCRTTEIAHFNFCHLSEHIRKWPCILAFATERLYCRSVPEGSLPTSTSLRR